MELHERGVKPLESLLAGGSLVVDPPKLVLSRLLERTESELSARVVLSPAVAAAVSEEFLLETRIADAIAHDGLRVRETGSQCDDRLILGETAGAVLVTVGQHASLLSLEAETMVEELRSEYEPRWEDGEPVSTRAPPRSQLFDYDTAELPEAFSSELERALEGASTLKWHGSPTPIELALAVGARVGAHHYDLCEWAEATGFTSRSSIARGKQRLEAAGLLDYEPVPQERGRPRQQLVVDNDRVAAADAEELVATLRRVRT